MALESEIRDANHAATQRIRALGERLTNDELLQPVGQHWTVAITLAHLAFWDRRALDAIQRIERGETVTEVDIAANDISLPLWAAIPPRDAVRLALEAADRLDARLDAASSDLVRRVMDIRPRWVRRHLHRNEHLDEAEEAVAGRPGRQAAGPRPEGAADA